MEINKKLIQKEKNIKGKTIVIRKNAILNKLK